jgi:hypothetical protein
MIKSIGAYTNDSVLADSRVLQNTGTCTLAKESLVKKIIDGSQLLLLLLLLLVERMGRDHWRGLLMEEEEEEEEEEEAMPHMESARRINVPIEEPLPLMVVANSCLQVILPCTVFLAMHCLVVNNFLLISCCILRDLPQQKIPRELCLGRSS